MEENVLNLDISQKIVLTLIQVKNNNINHTKLPAKQQAIFILKVSFPEGGKILVDKGI